jgi:hypothetical protein
VRILLLAAALVLTVAGPARAVAAVAPPLRPFPVSGGNPGTAPPETDGLRYVVVNAAPGVVRIFDTETKKARDVSGGSTIRPASRASSPDARGDTSW